MSATKRARTECSFRVVLDVGGAKFPTTRSTVERSSFLMGLIDASAWDAAEERTEEIFIDRDPEIFALLLRLMRQVPLMAGLLPHDREKFALLLAEADFFGFDVLLDHVKARAFYHTRDVAEDLLPYSTFLPDNYTAATWAERIAMRNTALEACSLRHKQIRKAFNNKDEAYGCCGFDKLHGSISDALGSGVLPAAYFKRNYPDPTTRIVQLLPVQATTWFLIGDAQDDHATVVVGARFPDQDDAMKPMREIIQRPAIVRRVACHALMENEQRKQWIEPMIYLEPDDLEEWMNDQPHDGSVVSRDNTMGDSTCLTQTGGSHVRTMRAHTYLEHAKTMYGCGGLRRFPAMGGAKWWTHLLVAEQKPDEFGVSRSDDNGTHTEVEEAEQEA